MENQDELYEKGFNAGYLLSKHDPELLKGILKSANKDTTYFRALVMGQKEHNRELLLEQLKQSQVSKAKDKGLER